VPGPQFVAPVVAGAAGCGLIVTITRAEAASQGACWPVVLSVRMTIPAVISAADGRYVTSNVVASGAKVPEPEDVQKPPVAPPPTKPPKAAVSVLAQIVWLPPALAVTACCIITTTCAVAWAQGACCPVELSVSVTVPAVISSPEGL